MSKLGHINSLTEAVAEINKKIVGSDFTQINKLKLRVTDEDGYSWKIRDVFRRPGADTIYIVMGDEDDDQPDEDQSAIEKQYSSSGGSWHDGEEDDDDDDDDETSGPVLVEYANFAEGLPNDKPPFGSGPRSNDEEQLDDDDNW